MAVGLGYRLFRDGGFEGRRNRVQLGQWFVELVGRCLQFCVMPGRLLSLASAQLPGAELNLGVTTGSTTTVFGGGRSIGTPLAVEKGAIPGDAHLNYGHLVEELGIRVVSGDRTRVPMRGRIDQAEELETRRRPQTRTRTQSPGLWDRSMIGAGRSAVGATAIWCYLLRGSGPRSPGRSLSLFAFPFAFSFVFPLTLSFALDLSSIRFEHSSPPVPVGRFIRSIKICNHSLSRQLTVTPVRAGRTLGAAFL